VEMRVLDCKTDNGERVVITPTRNGHLSLAIYKDCGGGRPLWGMCGACLVDREIAKAWITTVHELLRSEFPLTHANHARLGGAELPLPGPPWELGDL
jgi:hypothetical protein